MVVSLAAVSIALAAGVIIGSLGLSGTTVTGLRDDKGGLQSRIDGLVADNAIVNRKLSAAEQFDTQMSARIVAGALAEKSVVLFRTPDADAADVDAVAALVRQAGGTLTGTVELTAQFVDANSGEKLRAVVNSPLVPAGAALNTALLDPSAQAGDLLGIALLIDKDPAVAPVDEQARDTVLTALRDTGFLRYDAGPAAADVAVVVTGGPLPADAGNRGASVAKFAAALAPHGSGTVLAGRDGVARGALSAVALTRADPTLSGAVTTVDDIGTAAGRITAVLALQAMLTGAPPQKYGIGEGATAVTVAAP